MRDWLWKFRLWRWLVECRGCPACRWDRLELYADECCCDSGEREDTACGVCICCRAAEGRCVVAARESAIEALFPERYDS
jgi:hypothetical protein